MGVRKTQNWNTLENILERTILDDNGCWNWTGSLTKGDYGTVAYQGKSKNVHRLVYELVYGKIGNTKLLCCHKCDNRKCINPTHIFLGTHKDNFEDAVSKGRKIKGRPRGNFKLVCKNGHTYIEGSYYLTKSGHKVCKECRLNNQRNFHRKKKLKDEI